VRSAGTNRLPSFGLGEAPRPVLAPAAALRETIGRLCGWESGHLL
jgi:hypothetical protein